MFKGLRKKLELGVAQSPLAGVIKRGADEKPENETPKKAPSDSSGQTLPGASGDDSPAKLVPSTQDMVDGATSNPAVGQLVDIPLFNNPLEEPSTPTNGTPHPPRSRQSSISSVGSESPFFPPLHLTHQGYDLPSEAESEMDETISTLDGYTKEDLYNVIKRLERRSFKYKGRFKDVVAAYKDLRQDKEKIKNSLTLSQDKAFRRISELKEQAGLDRLAKRDLEENYRLMLEEKDEVVSVLQTQVRLLKEGKDVPAEIEAKSSGNAVSKSGDGDTGGGDAESTAALLEKVKRQDALLNRCKESIKGHKEKIAQLSTEKLNLEKQLEEAASQSKGGSPSSPGAEAENSKLKKQIQQARLVIEDLEAEKQLAVAEAKQQIHEQLETKDQEILNVKASLQTQADENIQLQERNEKLQNSAEETLQKSREIIKRLKDEKAEAVAAMEERLKSAEASLELEKQSLVQELSRGKTAAVTLLQEESEKRLEASVTERNSALRDQGAQWQERLTQLENMHHEALLVKDKEREQALHQQEEKVQRRLADKEEEMRLTVEERDLQKMAALSQQDSAKDDLLQQIEALKLVKLELENMLVKLREDHESETTSWQKEREGHISEANRITEESQNKIDKLKSDHDAKFQEQAQNFNEIQIQQIAELNQKHEDMVQGSSSEVEEFYKAQMETLKTSHESLLHEKLTQAEKLNETVILLQDHLGTLEAEWSSKYSDEISAIENLVVKYESEITDLKNNLQSSNELKEESNKKLEEKDIEMNALQATFRGNLETSNTEWKQKLDELESEHKKHLEQVSQSDNTRVADAENKVDQLHQQIEELTKTHLDLSEEKNSIEESRLMLETAMEALKTQVENEAHFNADVKEQLERQTEEMRNVQKLMEEKNTEMNLLDARCQDLDSQLIKSNKIAEEKTNEIQKMQEKFGQLKTEAKSRIKDLKERTDQMAEDLASKTVEVQTLSTKLDETESNKTTEISTLQEKLNESQELQKSLEESFKEKFQERQQQYKDTLQNTKENFQTQLAEKEQGFQEKLNEIFKQKEENLEGVTNDLETIRQKQLEELTSSHKRQLQDTVSEWESKLSECKETHSSELTLIQQSYSEQIDSLKVQVEEISTARQMEVTQLEQQFEAVSVKLKDTDSALEKVNAQKEQELSVIKEQLVSVQSSSTGQVSSLQEEREILINQNESLLKTKEEQISNLEEQVSTLKQNFESISEKYVTETQEKDLQFQNAQKEIKELQTTTNSLQETLTSISSSSSDSEKQIISLNEEHLSVIKTFEASLQEKNSLVEDLQQKLHMSENSCRESETSVASLKEELAEKTQKLESLENEYVSSDSEKQTILAKLQEQIPKLEISLSEKEQAFVELRSLYEALEVSSNATVAEKETRLSELNQVLEMAANEKLQLKEQYEESLERVQNEMGAKVTEQQSEMEERLRNALAEEERVKGKSNRDEDRLMIEHKQMIEELYTDLHDKDKHIEDMTELHANQLKEKESEALDKFKDLQDEVTALQEKTTLLSSEHQEALQLLEEQLEAGFKKRFADKEASYRVEIDALSKEWNAERQIEFVSAETTEKSRQQELVVENQLALTAIQSGSNSGELLRQQLIDQTAKIEDLKSKHRLEVAELRSQIEMVQNRQPLMAPPGHRNLFEEFEPRAAEEIQNLELHNMDLQAQVSQLNTDLRHLEDKEKQRQNKLEDSFHQSPGVSFHTPGASFHTPPSSPYPLSNNSTPLGPLLNEPTEMEYLRNILFQYMIGKETKTLAKVIATVMKFTDDQTNKIIAKEDSKLGTWLSSP